MKKVLLIGGTDSERTALKIALEAAGYSVSSAVTRKYTNRWLGRRIKPFDLIIYDLADAPQSPDFWPELREQAGATLILVLTDPGDSTDYAALGMNRVLCRPHALDEIVQTAHELCA
jgi:DNA-binding response OmpR family regulator